jgi:hypothetical protein
MKAGAITVSSALLALFVNGLAAARVYAEHETRAEVIQETGVNVVLIALVMVAAAVVLALFAAIILWWERQDEDADSISPRQTPGHGEGDA